jgi:hypothetical protein
VQGEACDKTYLHSAERSISYYFSSVRAPAQTGKVLRMKVSYNEDLANHIDSESCVVVGNCGGEALTGGDTGRVLSREKLKPIWGVDAVDGSGRQHFIDRYREIDEDPARSKTLCMYPSTLCGSREIPRLTGSGISVRIGNSKEVIR